jgi:riboflavin kinase / FMN adenylyltransferase
MPLTLSGIPKAGVNKLAIGVFDGMHSGHCALSKNADAILTFFPHPAVALGFVPEADFKYLTLPNEITHYAPHTITFPFTTESAKIAPADFLNNILLTQINPKEVIVGYDFHFGHKKEGSISTLREWGSKHNIIITQIPKISAKDGTPIKSTIIRSLLGSDFNNAIDLLGHSYLIKGIVEKGDGRGSSLGYPTANINVPKNKLIPKPGVYKGQAQVGNTTHKAGIYIGNKPTFPGSQNTIEAHLINYQGDLYNQPITLFLESYLRDQIKFKSKADLITQIKKDLKKL